jgi:hypothetical protein
MQVSSALQQSVSVVQLASASVPGCCGVVAVAVDVVVELGCSVVAGGAGAGAAAVLYSQLIHTHISSQHVPSVVHLS